MAKTSLQIISNTPILILSSLYSKKLNKNMLLIMDDLKNRIL